MSLLISKAIPLAATNTASIQTGKFKDPRFVTLKIFANICCLKLKVTSNYLGVTSTRF